MILELVFVSASILAGIANVIRGNVFAPESLLFIIILGILGAFLLGYHQKEREIVKGEKNYGKENK